MFEVAADALKPAVTCMVPEADITVEKLDRCASRSVFRIVTVPLLVDA